jgi:hypothetical protein
MPMTEPINLPFWWNIAKREQLGRLIAGNVDLPPPPFIDAIHVCCAHVLAFSDDADLVFIGRSPESLFDYLSGLLAPTSWAERCLLVNLALRNLMAETVAVSYPAVLRSTYPGALELGRQQLQVLELAPATIITRPRPIAFVDLVATGSTFRHLWELLFDWASEQQLDLSALKRKLRFIGITEQHQTSPNTWRWHQQAAWTKQLRPQAIKNVAIPQPLWSYLGNTQPKTSVSHPPWRWGTEEMTRPSRDGASLAALRQALHLYDLGNSRDQRHRFAGELAQGVGMAQRWYRSLIHELRRVG